MIEGYRPLQARLSAIGDTRVIARELGLNTVRYAKHGVARKTATTARSIRLSQVTETSATVTVGGAGAFLERGTRPHVIRPRNKKALFFPSQKALTARAGPGAILKTTLSGRVTRGTQRRFGNLAYAHARFVRHPGTKAQPFLIPAARKAAEVVGITRLIERWNEAA